ncbi:hypothetical protein MP228_011145 [Amoeboaphelidium protococcarum]|nr:hypothetical protein MP228_011145 [Amoeboaphelidium protococcarum]
MDAVEEIKKPKKTVSFQDDSVVDKDAGKQEQSTDASKPAVDEEDPAAMFAGLKKKKKSSSKSKAAAAAAASEDNDDMSNLSSQVDNMTVDSQGSQPQQAQDEEVLDFSKMKKKKKKSRSDTLGDDNVVDPNENPLIESEDAWQKTDRDYTYHELLDRVFRIIKQHNPDFGGQRKGIVMTQPDVYKEGSKKTAFANIVPICQQMGRPVDHLISYLYAELATQGSTDGSGRLIIKGRFQQGQIESVLRKYIVEYVRCQTCKSADTVMVKENRLVFVQCKACGSRRTVSAIKGGFRAQTSKRKLMRQQ